MSSEIQAGRVYTDVQGLTTLRTKAREGSPEALKAAAKQFEAYLVQQLLQTSRAATHEVNPAGGALGDESGGPYQDMFDKQVSLTVTSGHGLGVADLLVRQLDHGSSHGRTASSAQTPTPAVTGAAAPARSTAAATWQESAGAPFAFGGVPAAGTGASLASALAGTKVPLASALAGPAAAPASAFLEGFAQFTEATEVSDLATTAPLVMQVSADLLPGSTPVRFTNSDAFVKAVMPYAQQVGYATWRGPEPAGRPGRAGNRLGSLHHPQRRRHQQ